MNFNSYDVYSMISQVEEVNQQDSLKITKLMTKLDSMRKINDVREYLKQELEIEGNIDSLPYGKDGFINIEDSPSLLIINIIFHNENIMYCYNKRGE